MPQIRIEYSSNIAEAFDARAFALRIHGILPRLVETELRSCKTRLVELDRTVIGDGGADQAMIHVDLRILSGRTDEQKKGLGEAAMELLTDAVRKPEGLKLQLTLEVRELDRANYHKRLVE